MFWSLRHILLDKTSAYSQVTDWAHLRETGIEEGCNRRSTFFKKRDSAVVLDKRWNCYKGNIVEASKK